MKLTPETYNLLNSRWENKIAGKANNEIFSASKLQTKISTKYDNDFFKYVPCPICFEDRFTIFHSETLYAVKRWQNFILKYLVRMTGKNLASKIVSSIMRRNVDFSRKGYSVVKCVSCNFIYRNPTYQEKTLQEAYNKHNYSKFLLGKYSARRIDLYEYILEQSGFGSRTANLDKKKILDLGCGFGLFLNLMKSKGWVPYGFDFAEDAIEYGKKELGLDNIEVGNLEEDSFAANTFEAISLISVAAHLDEPLKMFSNIYNILTPGGILLIWTVNAGSINHKYFLENWGGFSLNHLIFFDSESITNALKKVGFDQVDISYDVRLFNNLSQNGTISSEHREYFKDLMKKENLGDMLAVLATK